MPGRRTYDLLYRVGAARWSRGWDRGVAPELARLVESGRLAPKALPPGRAVDLGCGTGADALFLADRGFWVTGVDFSRVAVERARRSAAERGLTDRARFVLGDVTARDIPGAEGPFDLVVAYNTLQDLWKRARPAMAATVGRLTRPGGKALLWCYYGRRRDLPPISFRGPSHVAPFVVAPGGEVELFGDDFDIERLAQPAPGSGAACFLMTRR